MIMLSSSFKMIYIYHDGILYVLDGPVRLQVLRAKHDVLATCHFGFNNTMELVSRDYWWPQLWKYVKEFVGSCNVYA
jgi:hypothetical protein